MLWHKTIGAGGVKEELTLTFFDNTALEASSASSFTLPSNQEGDLLIVMGQHTSADTVPSGWTLAAQSVYGSRKNFIWYKIAESGDTSITKSWTFPDIHGLCFRPSKPVEYFTHFSASSQSTPSNPAAQTVTSGSSGSPVTLVVGGAFHPTITNAPFSTFSPSADETITEGIDGSVAYKIYNEGDTPVNHTIDMNDLGAYENALCSAYFEIEPVGSSRAVEYSGIYDSVISSGGTLNIPAVADSQMVVFMERANSATPPATRSGFTSAVTSSVAALNRSMRLSYRVGGSSESITVSNNAGFAIFNYATTIGQTAAYGVNTTTSSPPIPAISSLDTSGNSALFASPYLCTQVTGVASPYTVIDDFGAYIEENTSASIAQTNFTTGIAIYPISCVMEIKN